MWEIRLTALQKGWEGIGLVITQTTEMTIINLVRGAERLAISLVLLEMIAPVLHHSVMWAGSSTAMYEQL